jgi:leucyl aminopeptidase
MDPLKPKSPKIAQDRGTLTAERLDSLESVVLLLPCDADVSRIIPYGTVIAQRMRRVRHRLDARSPLVVELPNERGTRVALAGIDPEWNAFELLTLGRKLVAALGPGKVRRLALGAVGLGPDAAERAIEAALAAALAADFNLPSFKSKPENTARLEEIRIYGHRAAHGYARTLAGARGNNIARHLTALPPNDLTPRRYRRHVERLARAHRWRARFLDTARLKALGAGAFLAVAQGSPEPDAGILHLRYTPAKPTRKKPVALVGKGICFDTGGTNLKPARHMHGMHEDMEGSAVALGTLLALTELKVDFPVDCWLALAQNHIGPKAYRQNEVVRAADGTTIEVTHTDAEGRMILADTLYLASREKPGLIVDYATLTGACVAALSSRMSGAFSNRETLLPRLIEAGARSGERVWPFPVPADYREALKSEIADIKQCTLDNDADHILAAVFLQGFLTNDPDWVHIDLAAGNHKGGLAHIPTDITGFGVRLSLELLLEQPARGAGRNE